MGEKGGNAKHGHDQREPAALDHDLGEGPTGSPHPQTPCSLRPPPAPPNKAPPRRVNHTYRDYTKFPLSMLPTDKKCPGNFPSKLHRILSEPAHSHIISWMPHGRAWKIHNKELLVREVISRYFAQSRCESFTRQLNGWGFKRLHQCGNDCNAYYHECFLRGLSHLTALMKRVTLNQGKLLPHVEGEPNFYEMDKRHPLRHPSATPPHGGYHYSPPHAANVVGYESPPGPSEGGGAQPMPAGYFNDCSPQPSIYPPLPPPYAPEPDYPPHSYYLTQYSHPPPQYFPYRPGPPGPPPGSQFPTSSCYDTSPPNREEVRVAPHPEGSAQKARASTMDEAEEHDLEPIQVSLPNQAYFEGGY